MPAAAAPTSAAPSRTTPAAVKTSATPSSDAKSGNPTSAAGPTDTDADDNADAPPATANTSDAWLSSGIRVPTLQPPAASLAPTASILMGATATNDSDESESAADPVDTTETSADSTPDVTKSAFALGASAPPPGTRSDSAASAPADGMPSATAAAAAAQAGPLQNPAHAQPATDARAPTEIRAPVGSPAWTEELGTQLTWMTSHGQDSASLRLAPEHLGPVEVRIDVRDGAASVWFGAAHADTRSALEQSLPRLRELFAASGLLLADAGVARDAPRQNARSVAPVPLAGSAGDTSITTSKASSGPTHSGLVDTYV
jgi:flagellar hook-length control protein FliK